MRRCRMSSASEAKQSLIAQARYARAGVESEFAFAQANAIIILKHSLQNNLTVKFAFVIIEV